MTLPHGRDDVDTVNGIYLISASGQGDTSIADLATQDETSVRARYKEKFADDPDSVWRKPTSPLKQVFGDNAGMPGLFKRLVGRINGDGEPSGPIDDIIDAVPKMGTFADLKETWNRIVGGHTNQAVTDATLGDVERVMFDISRDITNTAAATITLTNWANAPKTVPEWVSPNPFEDVSYPRAILTKIVSDTDTANGLVGVHTHSVSDGTYVVPAVVAADGDAYFNTVTCTYDRVYNTAGFVTDGGATLPPSVYLSIWLVDNQTGQATLEYDFGNVKPLMATGVVGDLIEQRFTTTRNLYPLAGEKRRVVVVPVGGPLSLGAIRRTTISNTGFYPRYSSGRLTGQTGTPLGPIADSALISSNFRVWTCLGQQLEPDVTPVSLIENFAVSDTKNWQSNSWQQFYTADDRPRFRVTSGQLYLQDGAGFGTILGNWAMQRIALHKTRLHTPNQAVEITLGTDWETQAYDFAYVAAVLRATAGATAGVTMQLDSPDNASVRVRICSHDSSVGVITAVRATATGVPYSIGDRFRIEVVNEAPVDSGSPLYVYRCYRNDVEIPGAAWPDTAGVIPDVDAYLSVGFTVGARDNGLTLFNPAHLASWVATDLSDATP